MGTNTKGSSNTHDAAADEYHGQHHVVDLQTKNTESTVGGGMATYIVVRLYPWNERSCCPTFHWFRQKPKVFRIK